MNSFFSINKNFIIAEIGPNHNGSFVNAKKMIKQIANAGADAIKFQLALPTKVYSQNAFKAKYQIKNTDKGSIIEMSKKYQLTRDQHIKLAKECKKNNVIYCCSAFDIDSLIFLNNNIDLSFFKIPSGEILSFDILDYISKQKLPIILSTGMATFNEIKIAVKNLNKYSKKNISLLHCVSSYPAKKYNLNLNVIDELKKIFKLPIGYSDHSLGIDACLAAVAKGTAVIEKHVTLDKKLPGPDHKISVNINEFKNLVKRIRIFEKMLGENKKVFSKNEIEVRNMSRKSLVAKRKILKGKKLTRNDICLKRPGNGISPNNILKVINRKAKRQIFADRLIKIEDLY